MTIPLYDCFICHASEDKDAFVRPLAEGLRGKRIEVWYDEFTLKVGDGLRRSIDRGLSQSRFGVVVLSPSFFSKSWTNWELDGLLQRQLYEPSPVILPIWHGIDRATVADYSPSLADKVAISSQNGVGAVVNKLLQAIKPEGSALIAARDVAHEYGLTTPVISDDWWLDVIEDGAYQDQRRFAFFTSDVSSSRGEQIAWWAMQKSWQEAAKSARILQTTHPCAAWAFINSHPGLRDACEHDPKRLADYMPQLTIAGFGGAFEDLFASMHARSRAEGEQRRQRNDPCGSALTVDKKSPICDEEFLLRDPDFGFYEPSMPACGFVQGFGAGLGPHVSGMPTIDYVIWFLSSASDWLPRRIHSFLLEGLKDWNVWPNWHDQENHDLGYSVEHDQTLQAALLKASGVRSFKLATHSAKDLHDRIALSARIQTLPEEPNTLVDRFITAQFIERWFASEDRYSRRRRSKRRVSR